MHFLNFATFTLVLTFSFISFSKSSSQHVQTTITDDKCQIPDTVITIIFGTLDSSDSAHSTIHRIHSDM